AAREGRRRSRDLSSNEDAMDSPSSSPDTRSRRTGRRRSLASPVGPPLLDAEEAPPVRRGGKATPVLSLSKRPSLSWIVGNWVMDLSMYTPADAPPPVHIENRSHWPRAFLDYDRTVMDDATLASRGDDIVDLVRAECSAREQRLTDKPPDDIVRKTFDGVRCLYVVHASMDIPSSFDDVVSILTHRSFLGHVFGPQMLAATELWRAANSTSSSSTTAIQRLHLHVPRGYKRQQAMQVTFLDHARGSAASPSAPASWTRVFKSVDRQTSGTAPDAVVRSSSSTIMTHVVGGLHVEALSASRTRVSFYGDSCVPSVLAVKMDGTHAFLDAFGQSVALVHRMLRRRRSHRHHLHHLHMPSRTSPPFDDVESDGVSICPHAFTTTLATPTSAPSGVLTLDDVSNSTETPALIDTSRCRLCAVRFHFFRAVHPCATCHASFCAACLRRHAPLCHPPSPASSSSSSSSPTSSPEATPSLVTHPPIETQSPGEGQGRDGATSGRTSTPFSWTWRRCVAEPLRQSLSANHFSALLQDDDEDVETIRLLRRQHRAASFD
ncbi:hypothetical protein H310_07245, partial [Aphanomyces invadans]